MMLLFQVFLSVVITIIIIIITSRVIAGSDPIMKKSKKNFNENYLESEKSFNKFSLVLFERENFQNLKVMKVKKNFNKII